MSSVAKVPPSFLAKLFGVTTRRVQQLAQEGVIPPSEKGEYQLIGSVKGYVAFLQNALNAHGGSTSEELAHARLRYEKARAEKEEIEVAKLIGAVVLADDVEQIWNAAAFNWRAKILALPDKIALRTLGAADRVEIEETVTGLIEKTLGEISLYGSLDKNSEPKKTRRTGGKRRAKPKAAAEADGEPVGG